MAVDQAHPELEKQLKGIRGRQKHPTKLPITIRLDADVVDYFHETGHGWQTRLKETLRWAVFGNK